MLAACGVPPGIAQAADGRSDGGKPPAPTALWQRFPLREGDRLGTTQDPRLEAPRSRQALASPGGQEQASRGTLPGALTVALEAVLIGALVVALFAVGRARRHSHGRPRREVATRASEWMNYAEHLALWTGGNEQPGEGGMDNEKR